MDAHQIRMQALAPLVGRWSTQGEIFATESTPAEPFTAIDSYEWEAGDQLLLHRWDADMPTGRSRGIEVIGPDPSAGDWFVHAYDDQGGKEEMRARLDDDRWLLTGAATRFSGRFSPDRSLIRGEWELRQGDAWQPWMWVELTRTD